MYYSSVAILDYNFFNWILLLLDTRWFVQSFYSPRTCLLRYEIEKFILEHDGT